MNSFTIDDLTNLEDYLLNLREQFDDGTTLVQLLEMVSLELDDKQKELSNLFSK